VFPKRTDDDDSDAIMSRERQVGVVLDGTAISYTAILVGSTSLEALLAHIT